MKTFSRTFSFHTFHQKIMNNIFVVTCKHVLLVPQDYCAHLFGACLWTLSNSKLPSSTSNLKYTTMFLFSFTCRIKLWMLSFEKPSRIKLARSCFNYETIASSFAWPRTCWFLLSSICEQAHTLARTISSFPFFSTNKSFSIVACRFTTNVK